MRKFDVSVTYETKKGGCSWCEMEVWANSEEEAIESAVADVLKDGRRQAVKAEAKIVRELPVKDEITGQPQPRTHLETEEGPTGWETVCGRRSSSLTSNPEEVDCKACRKAAKRAGLL